MGLPGTHLYSNPPMARSFIVLAGELFSGMFLVSLLTILSQKKKGEIAGIPRRSSESVLFGNSLTAAPFCVEGGPLAIDIELERLDQEAIDLLYKLKAGSLEFRSRVASHAGWAVRKDLYAVFERKLSSEDEENLLAIPRKQRAVVRKTFKSGLTSRSTALRTHFSAFTRKVFAIWARLCSRRHTLRHF